MTTHSSILAWKIPQTEESGWLMGSKRVRHDCKTEHACRQAGTLQNTASEGKKKNSPEAHGKEESMEMASFLILLMFFSCFCFFC